MAAGTIQSDFEAQGEKMCFHFHFFFFYLSLNNNRMENTRDLFKKLEIPREHFMHRWVR